MCMNDLLPLCMSVYHVLQCPERSEEVIGNPTSEVTDLCEPSVGAGD